jgi:hypothetical protein
MVLAACGGNGTTSSGATAGDAPSTGVGQSTGVTPVTFRSRTYAYSMTLPPEWTAIQAYDTWDGKGFLSSESGRVDKFTGTSFASSWGVAAPWRRGLAAYARYLVAWNARFHGDTCPAKPHTNSPITVGGEPGVLLAYDCGILINIAGTVHDGVGYWFGFRDPSVQAATDPADRRAFLQILGSVHLPG